MNIKQQAKHYNEISVYTEISRLLKNSFGVEAAPLLYRKDTTLLDCGVGQENIESLRGALVKKFNLPAKFTIKYSQSWDEIISMILNQQNTGGDNTLTSKKEIFSKKELVSKRAVKQAVLGARRNR